MLSKLALAAVAVVALAACGTAAASQKSSSGATAATTARGATTVTLHKTKLGKVLATSSGMTLYLYTPDAKNKSNCYAGCSSVWPPLTTKGKVRAGTGVKANLLGITKRKNGQRQVTYNGHPLYRYIGDSKAGQAKGQGYGGIWFALKGSGKRAGTASTSASTGTTTSTNPYGY